MVNLKQLSKKVDKTSYRNKIKYKKVLRKNKMSVNVPEYKAPSVLGDENRFFKGEMEETRRAIFFS